MAQEKNVTGTVGWNMDKALAMETKAAEFEAAGNRIEAQGARLIAEDCTRVAVEALQDQSG